MLPRPTGKPPDPSAASAPGGAATAIDGKIVLAVELVHARGQHLRWILIGGIVGALFVNGLGTLGQGLGLVLIALGGWSGYLFVRTLRHPPGTLVVDADTVELPRGICRGEPSKLPRAAVTSAYFLRRAVPWTQAAPVLVIETGDRAFMYPRDYFASESDQRRILDALATA